MKTSRILFYSLLSVTGLFFTFSPAAHAQTVDVLWESDGYAPPFYEGGVVWGKEGMIHFVAVPQNISSPATRTYKWTKEGTVLGSLSGAGRSSLTFSDSIFSKPQTITVEIVSALDETITSTGAIVTPSSQSLLVYKRDPLYGFLLNREVSRGYSSEESEVAFGVFPFAFSIKTPATDLINYSWRSAAGEDGRQAQIIYRVAEGARGESNVSISASNPETIMQKAQSNFLIQFNNEQ